ncbi:hypothetical protein [Petrocella sp. FN5]|uniref:hypothetical protein n=1 Tax=Petrocella sp. FN5 TaxID=3032002 RepID=UPI0023DCE8D8|nr:hypothetical protein [Petrocella sp. FN5]MDF1616623.1 hypothetical protein [Petrocella sp. FN5]
MKNQKVQLTRSTNFLVSIYHQDHFSYQGLIHWIDTGEKIHFRSELELMNLIHNALPIVQNQEIRNWNKQEQGSA